MSSQAADRAGGGTGEPIIRVRQLGKCYQVYDRPADRLKQGVLGRRKQYFREFWALRDVSFDVRRGETVALIGRNGSGKSTLLQVIAGTLAPTTGAVEIRGRIAALLELGSGFTPEFTGRENVRLNAALLGLTDEEIAARFDEIVAFAGIGEFLDRPIKTYSTGMVLRLAFSVAVHVDADVLIVDEALAVGDAGFQFQCLDRLMRLTRSGTTLLFVTHDMSLVRSFCQQAIYLQQGCVRASGSAEEMTEQYFLDTWQPQLGQPPSGQAPSGAGTGHAAVRPKAALPGARGAAFGTDQGRITSAAFTRNGSGHMAVRSGDLVEIDITAEIDATVDRPHVSVTLQDPRLLNISGQWFALVDPRPLGDGRREARLRVAFDARLGPGAFFVSLRLESRQSNRVFLPIDKQVAALHLEILPGPTDTFFGAVDLGLRQQTPDAARADRA